MEGGLGARVDGTAFQSLVGLADAETSHSVRQDRG